MGVLIWRWPWVFAIVAVAIAVVLVSMWWRNRRNYVSNVRDDDAEVWNIDTHMQTESIAEQYRTWRNLNRLAVGLLCLALIVAGALNARPSSVDTSEEHSSTRDIVLCLDVSGSALPYDRTIIATYLGLVSNFQGERIGMSIFNSTSRTVFPLTDDYSLVSQQLRKADKILDGVQSQKDIDKMSDKDYQAISDWLDGTQNRENETSLIGDGLVNCSAMLPGFSYSGTSATGTNSSRSSSIVLATDNVVSGKSTYSLKQALDLAQSAKINVDGLFAGPQESEDDATTIAMKDEIQSHGGIFLATSANAGVEDLVKQIESKRNGSEESNNQASIVDEPTWWVLGLAILYGGFMLTVWRLRR
ncbi:VWA domain-containing protein [Bifidobacterium aquikefiri]|uniref:VWA domain-containing protein n=1 Tax=Bifidobacterium aquikefiri TaxID=1653207 RepID=UPI0039EB9FB0